MDIDVLCYNISVLKQCNGNLTNCSFGHDESFSETTESPTKLPNMENSTFNASAASGKNVSLEAEIEEFLITFDLFTEWYGIPVVAIFGIICNLTLVALLTRDKHLRCMSLFLHISLLILESLYLAAIFAFVQIRHFASRGPHWHWMMSVASISVNATMMASVWLIYGLACDSHSAVRVYLHHRKGAKLTQSRLYVPFVLLGVIIFHVPYVPEIRILLYWLHPSLYDPCRLPIVDHWEFHLTNPNPPYDYYYILYYSAAYTLLTFALPFFWILWRDKDLIDVLHEVKEAEHPIHPGGIYEANTGTIVSIICNVTATCLIPKLVLMLFNLFSYLSDFLHPAYVYFHSFSILANLMLAVRAAVYLPLFVCYSARLRRMVWRSTFGRLRCCQQLLHILPWLIRRVAKFFQEDDDDEEEEDHLKENEGTKPETATTQV